MDTCVYKSQAIFCFYKKHHDITSKPIQTPGPDGTGSLSGAWQAHLTDGKNTRATPSKINTISFTGYYAFYCATSFVGLFLSLKRQYFFPMMKDKDGCSATFLEYNAEIDLQPSSNALALCSKVLAHTLPITAYHKSATEFGKAIFHECATSAQAYL